MRPNDGNPVTGEDFFNRTEEIKRLREHLENGQHLNLMSPRRCGKTSIMREVMRRMKNDGWATLEVDFAGCSNIQAFFTKLASKLDEAIESRNNQGENLVKKSKQLVKSVKDVKFGKLEWALTARNSLLSPPSIETSELSLPS